MSEDSAALCAYLREADGEVEGRHAAVRALSAMPGVDLDLSGTVLTDADFSGGRFGEVSFTDTRFVGRTSFAGAEFAGDAVFARALFEGEVVFDRARFGGLAVFGGRVHLDAPAVDLTGARWAGTDATWRGDWATWPWGWSVRDEVLTAEPSRAVRTDPEALAAIGEQDPAQRQPVVDAICAYLRTPLLFAVRGNRTAEQDRVVAGRQAAQRVLAAKLGPGGWAGLDLRLSGATLIDLDLTGCRGGVADFTGAQFHGPTRLERDGWERIMLDLGGGEGRATFHDGL